MSRHHWNDTNRRISMPIKNKVGFRALNHFVRPVVIVSEPRAARIGHGLWSTI